MKFGNYINGLALAALVLLVVGCDGRRETREVLFTPDMHFSPAMKAQEADPFSPTGSSMRMPPEGTVPQGFEPYTITDAEADELASKLQNPLPRTWEVMKAGEKYFNIYCTPCHGETGDGMGTVITAQAGMPMPPSLFSDKLVDEWTDGRIFHVITRGQGNMPPYASRLSADRRWAVIHYVRALQRAAHPTEEDLAQAEALEPKEPAGGTEPAAAAH
ncbi:cytochrome c [bacterium]|nr:cytochrome c [bacterium]